MESKIAEAVETCQIAIAMHDAVPARDSHSQNLIRMTFAEALMRADEHERSEAVLSDLISCLEVDQAEFPLLLTARYHMGKLMIAMDRADEATGFLYQLLDDVREQFGSDHFRIGFVSKLLANLHLRLGEPSCAKDMAEKAAEVFSDVFEADHRNVLTVDFQLAICAGKMKQSAFGVAISERIIPLIVDAYSMNHPQTANVLVNTGRLYKEMEMVVDADAAFRAGLDIYAQIRKGNEWSWVRAVLEHATFLRERGCYVEAGEQLALIEVAVGNHSDLEPVYQRLEEWVTQQENDTGQNKSPSSPKPLVWPGSCPHSCRSPICSHSGPGGVTPDRR
jgi:tetratricopeptide (TPR) repeat protein